MNALLTLAKWADMYDSEARLAKTDDSTESL